MRIKGRNKRATGRESESRGGHMHHRYRARKDSDMVAGDKGVEKVGLGRRATLRHAPWHKYVVDPSRLHAF
jgi:hypothetical protein